MKKPSKAERQNRILRLILEYPITTQTELVEYMEKEGLNITQATISRDIKELNIVKVANTAGEQRYVSMGRTRGQAADRLLKVFAEAVISVQTAGNMLVLKTLPGMASAGGSAVDSLELPGVLGSLAGDDTIFIVADSDETAGNLALKLNHLLG